jgi:hypothetical protein
MKGLFTRTISSGHFVNKALDSMVESMNKRNNNSRIIHKLDEVLVKVKDPFESKI